MSLQEVKTTALFEELNDAQAEVMVGGVGLLLPAVLQANEPARRKICQAQSQNPSKSFG